jgi:hypothetical protein
LLASGCSFDARAGLAACCSSGYTPTMLFHRGVLIFAWLGVMGCAADASDDDGAAAVQLTSALNAEAQLVRAMMPPIDADAARALTVFDVAKPESDPAIVAFAASVVPQAQAVFSPGSCVSRTSSGTHSVATDSTAPPLASANVLAAGTLVLDRHPQVTYASVGLRQESFGYSVPILLRGAAERKTDEHGVFLRWDSVVDAAGDHNELGVRRTTISIRDDLSCTLVAGSVGWTASAGRGSAPRSTEVVVADYQVCADRCPLAGRAVRAKETRDGVTIARDMLFDGSSVARVSENGTRPTRVALTCTP